MSIAFRGKDLPLNRCSGVAAAVWLARLISRSQILKYNFYKYYNFVFIMRRITIYEYIVPIFSLIVRFTWNSHVGRKHNSRMVLNRKRYIIVVYRYIPTLLQSSTRARVSVSLTLTHPVFIIFDDLHWRWHTKSP